MNLHYKYRLVSKFLLKEFGWLDSNSILLQEDGVEIQMKTSVTQPTKMLCALVTGVVVSSYNCLFFWAANKSQ